MMKWEYKAVDIYGDKEESLNALGKGGWELVAMEDKNDLYKGSFTTCYFKRPL